MNVLPEIVRAGADDWMFILFVVFAIAAQAIEANRKKKLAEQKKASRPTPRGAASPKTPQQELESFLKSLHVERETGVATPHPEPVRPSPAPPPHPKPIAKAKPKPMKPPVPSPEKAVAEQDFKKRYSGAASVQEAAVPSVQMAENEGVSHMLQQSRALVMNMQGIKMPTIPLGPRLTSGHKPQATFDINLKDRNELRRAILNQEILGKPKAMEPYR